MRGAWARWVAFWARTEHPRSLALVRILLGACITWDFLQIRWYGVVLALFGVQEVGGMSDAIRRATPPLWYQVFPGTEASAWGLHAALTTLAACFTLGLFTRSSALLLLLLWAQFADILPAADRGIDTLCRNVLVLFVFAGSGGWGSLDAKWRTGSVFGDGTPVGAWARYLLVLQIVLMYWFAGIQKTGLHWWPPGHFAALYFILQDPAIARLDFHWIRRSPFYELTQVGTIGTLLFQDTYPVVLWQRWLRATPERGGRLRALAERFWWAEWAWIGIGAFFHLSLAATCELGIFPWAMLALYPAWLHPDDWTRLLQRRSSPS